MAERIAMGLADPGHRHHLEKVLADLFVSGTPELGSACIRDILTYSCKHIGVDVCFVVHRPAISDPELDACCQDVMDNSSPPCSASDLGTIRNLLVAYAAGSPVREQAVHVGDIGKPDLKLIFGDAGVSEEEGTIPGGFTQGFWGQIRIPPVWGDLGGEFICYMLNHRLTVDKGLGSLLLRTILSMWWKVAASQKFVTADTLGRLRQRRTSGPSPQEVFDLMSKTHPLLTHADISQGLDSLMAALVRGQERATGDGAQTGLDSLAASFGKCKSCLLPCKLSSVTGEYPVLDWSRWRLSGRPSDVESNALELAVSHSRKEAALELSTAAPPIRLDDVLWKAVLPDMLKVLGGKKALPHPETAAYGEAREHLGRYAAMVLSGMSQTTESVDSTIWAISRYAYEGLGVDRRIHLASHMRHAARGEPSLHMMQEFHRDHFFHTIEVCFLGLVLIAARRGNLAGTLWPAFKSNKSILRQWVVASLMHDMGYAVDVCKGLRRWLEFFTSGSLVALGAEIKEAMEDMQKSDGMQVFYEQYGFGKKDKPWEDHGLLGAQHLHTLLKDINVEDDYDLAIEGIAKHSCTDVPIAYSPRRHLPALLALCDLIQGWRRPQFPHFAMGPAWMMSAMSGQPDPWHLASVAPKLWTNLRFEAVKDLLTPMFDGPLVLRLEFDDQVNVNSGTFNIWLDALRNLQRIDFTDLPHDILVQIVTPCYAPPGEQYPQRQMTRLRDAASETHMAYLSGFFDALDGELAGIPPVENVDEQENLASRGALAYHCEWRDLTDEERKKAEANGELDPPDKIPVREMLTFNLKKISGDKKFMTEELASFREDVKRWRRHGEDRTFVGDYSPWRHKRYD